MDEARACPLRSTDCELRGTRRLCCASVHAPEGETAGRQLLNPYPSLACRCLSVLFYSITLSALLLPLLSSACLSLHIYLILRPRCPLHSLQAYAARARSLAVAAADAAQFETAHAALSLYASSAGREMAMLLLERGRLDCLPQLLHSETQSHAGDGTAEGQRALGRLHELCAAVMFAHGQSADAAMPLADAPRASPVVWELADGAEPGYMADGRAVPLMDGAAANPHRTLRLTTALT
jgi:hypothetical protein